MIKNLKFLREQSKKSQKQVADALGLNTVTYNNWEKQKAEPNIENIKKLADYFGVSIDYLVGRDFKNDIGFVTSNQHKTIMSYLSLSEKAQEKVSGYIDSLADRKD